MNYLRKNAPNGLALEAAQDKLNELENLKATLLNAVTHELLTPFTPVGLALQVLQQQSVWWPEEHRDSLNELSSAIAKLHQRINGLVKCAELITKRRGPQLGYYKPYDIIQRPNRTRCRSGSRPHDRYARVNSAGSAENPCRS